MMEIFGFVGMALVLFAYLPQIRRLKQLGCSQSISLRAQWSWLFGSAMLLVHAVTIESVIFTFSQVVSITAVSITLRLAYKNRTGECGDSTVP